MEENLKNSLLIELIVNEYDKLERVNYLCCEGDLNFVRGIVFHFQKMTCCCMANANDDTIEIAEILSKEFLDEINLGEMKSIEQSRDNLWKHLINREIRWGWMLINQQGYTDGLQLEFKETKEIEQEEAVTIQLMVVASSIKVGIVSWY